MSISPTKLMLWVAKLIGLLVILFYTFFLVAHLIGNDESGDGLHSVKDYLLFFSYIILPIIGLAIAFKRHRLGGVLVLISILFTSILRPDLLISYNTLALGIPALLYITYSFILKA